MGLFPCDLTSLGKLCLVTDMALEETLGRLLCDQALAAARGSSNLIRKALLQ